MKLIRAVAWLGGGALVILAARAIVCALSPSPLAQVFEHEAGGPALPFVIAVAAVLGVGLGAAVVGVAALGVRERALLAEAPHRPSAWGRFSSAPSPSSSPPRSALPCSSPGSTGAPASAGTAFTA